MGKLVVEGSETQAYFGGRQLTCKEDKRIGKTKAGRAHKKETALL